MYNVAGQWTILGMHAWSFGVSPLTVVSTTVDRGRWMPFIPSALECHGHCVRGIVGVLEDAQTS